MADLKEKTYVEDVDRSIYDIRDEEHDAYRMESGLTPEIVDKLSKEKGDPVWMQQFRLQSLQIYTLILLLVGIAFLVIKWSWTNLVLLLVALIVLSVIRWLIKRQTIKYTRLEIAEIWRSEERQKEIINALQDK